ncbi:alpha-N-acetylgalactosaminide alpha-2,6-sialyltransferase 2 isoform X2 [Opisthocomus hoazin]|uniref:alpha-N-acetylgalactosaminide alpha-2,6-sialyltransferase 2 isoform X2 n=1 Tax=Opisthocomus hoazin TaxID=30419 RepID=UPI003F53A4EA
MGSPRWRRLWLLLLAALPPSLLLCGQRRGPAGPPASPPQPEPLALAMPGTSRRAGGRGETLDGGSESGTSSKPSAALEEPKPSRKQPSPCLRSVTARAKADPRFGEIFRFDTPVLMWDQHFTPQTWDRLKTRHVPYGWQGLSHAVVGSTLRLLNTSANRHLFDRDAFPGGCVRCAVVGNGGILNGSRQGKAIDAHDLVFRLNGAVIKGFEEDVGTKISFYGFTVNTMKNSLIAYEEYGFTQIPQAKDLKYIFIPSDIRDYVMLKSAIQGSPVPEGSDKGDRPQKYFGLEVSAEKFKLLHPDFLQYLTARLVAAQHQSAVPVLPRHWNHFCRALCRSSREVPAVGAPGHAVRRALHAQHRRAHAPHRAPRLRPGQCLRVHHRQLRAVLGPLLRAGEEAAGVLRQP